MPEGETQGSTSSPEVGQSGRYVLSGKEEEVRIRASSQADWAWTRSSTGRLPLPAHAPAWEAYSGDPALAWTGRCCGFRIPSGGALKWPPSSEVSCVRDSETFIPESKQPGGSGTGRQLSP